MSASARRQVAEALVTEHELPVRHACRAVGLSRTAWYRQPAPASERDAEVIAALTEIVENERPPLIDLPEYCERRAAL